MKRAALLSLGLLLGSCAFAQKHPGVTVGVVAGTIGFGACELSVEKLGTCSAIGGITGLVLGGITGIVTLIGETNAPPEEPPLADEEQPFVRRVRTQTPPPPVPLDAGVPTGEQQQPPSDAGVPAPDAL
jgi:hypothetical protein